MATNLQDTYVVAPDQPAPEVPAFKDTAQNIVATDPVGIMQGARAMLPPAPTQQEIQAARNNAADVRQAARQRQISADESFAAQKKEYELAIQQYEAQAEQVPQPSPVTQPPDRGLQPFLSSTAEESPYATIGKFVQAASLMATMAGGGRNGARASLSALTGAMEGWREGSRYKADAAYQTWKDETKAMLERFDDEMRSYNSIMIAKRIPIEQKWRMMGITAEQNRNALLADEIQAKGYDGIADALEKRIDARMKFEEEFAKVVAAKDAGDQKHQATLAKLEEQIRTNNLLADARFARLDVQRQLADIQAQNAQLRLDKSLAGKTIPLGEQKVFRDIENNDRTLKELDALADQVDLNKLVGGIRPWINGIAQKWGRSPGPMPEGQSIGTPAVKGAMTDKEQRFLALLAQYSDNIMRQRSGAAVGVKEMERMMTFLPNQGVTPQAVRTRFTLARDLNTQAGEAELQRMRQFGYDTGTYQTPGRNVAPAPGAPSNNPSDPLGIR
jgi:hypothetical protein